MENIDIVKEYHERTKHFPNRYAASLGYMDWATQPDPYRSFDGARTVPLPLPEKNDTPTYAELFGQQKAAPLTRDSLSRMLRYALGLAAIKCMGTECWALRCNASSGNLHPTEGYIILPPIEGIGTKSTVAHYTPKDHTLELLHLFDTDFWDDLPAGSFLFGISSIVWREAWKYGERAFRYTQLDAGHAIRSVTVAAHLNGWHTRLFDAMPPDTIDALLGFDQKERFRAQEEEISDALLLLTPTETPLPSPDTLLQACRMPYEGKANLLSPAHHPWEAITLVERATDLPSSPLPAIETSASPNRCDTAAETIILARRSARAMDFGRTKISMDAFRQLMHSTSSAFAPFASATSFVLFIHDVETLEPGLYLYLLNDSYLDTFKKSMRNDFVFTPVDEHLYLLEAGSFKTQAKFISCSQEIASDGAFSLGMLSEFTPQLERHGAQRYKSLYWECGAIGQQLYLEATSLGLSATGIGCFLDDVIHRLLGLEGDDFQSLYHFTIGRAIPDLRLQIRLPYADRR